MSLSPCPNCGKKISVSATSCPKCGHPLTAEIWDAARAARKKRDSVTWVFLVIIFVGYIIIGINWPTKDDLYDPNNALCDDPITVAVAVEKLIKNNLKSPSSAVFSPEPETVDKKIVPCMHGVTGWVDADNAFGASLRHYYGAIVVLIEKKEGVVSRPIYLIIDENREKVVKDFMSRLNDPYDHSTKK